MKTVSIIGLGNRGTEYGNLMKFFHARKVKIHSLCDIRQQALDDYGPRFRVPKERRYLSTEEFFAQGVVSDALMITTQDDSHFEIAKAALETGYKYILLEKPVSPAKHEYTSLRDIAKEKGALLIICHVLRYSYYYSKIKEIISSGTIGEIVSINHTENVGYYHFAHSYVRGNWRDEASSTPAVLAKTCHDLDLISWFIDSPCVSVSSVGGLRYFKKENEPEGAADYCMGGCKAKKNCPYDAEKIYLKDPYLKTAFTNLHKRTLTGKANNTKADMINAVKTGDYGRCVFRCDNDVCDHQLVTMQFESGAVAVMSLNAHSYRMFRECHIVGTKGELVGYGTDLRLNIFGGKSKKVRTGFPIGGHIEGDVRLVAGFVKIICGERPELADITTIDATIASHDIGLAAEYSRKNGGQVVELKEFFGAKE